MIVNNYAPLPELERAYGRHKNIPTEFRLPVLQALSHFPELVRTTIVFEPARLSVPFQVKPAILSTKKRFKVLVTEEADLPLREALLLHLPEEAARAAVAQQLALILHYEQRGSLSKLKSLLSSTSVHHREVTRQADLSVIEHGLGFELYVYAVYVRKIAGYGEDNELDKYYLHPQEIMDTLKVELP